jgi:hypothetical protein
VQLALLQLVRLALGPDRLADAAHAAAARARVLRQEAGPGGNDPRRVPAHNLHVLQMHVARPLAQRLPQQLELARADHDQHGLAALESGQHEVAAAVDELAVAGVEEGLVVEA